MIPNIVVTVEGGEIQSIDSDIPIKVIVMDVNPDKNDYLNKDTITDIEGNNQDVVVGIWNNDGGNRNMVEHVFKEIGNLYEI